MLVYKDLDWRVVLRIFAKAILSSRKKLQPSLNIVMINQCFDVHWFQNCSTLAQEAAEECGPRRGIWHVNLHRHWIEMATQQFYSSHKSCWGCTWIKWASKSLTFIQTNVFYLKKFGPFWIHLLPHSQTNLANIVRLRISCPILWTL